MKAFALLLCFFLAANLFPAKLNTSSVAEAWQNNAWVNSYRFVNTFDASGYLTTYAMENWAAATASWVSYLRADYTNNPNGTAMYMVGLEYLSGNWTNNYRMTYTYNGSKKITVQLYEDWENGAWAASLRYTNTYDGFGFLTRYQMDSWTVATSSWTPSVRYDYVNNTDGSATQATATMYTSGAFVNSSRTTSTYNGNKKIAVETVAIWQSNAWATSSRYTYTYDVSGYLTSYLMENWTAASSSWAPLARYDYVNDATGNATQMISQNYTAGNWVNGLRITYNYTDLPAVEKQAQLELKPASIRVSPNPSTGFYNVSFQGNSQRVIVSDIEGRTILAFTNPAKEIKMDLSRCPSGIYFITGKQGKFLESRKIIKQ